MSIRDWSEKIKGSPLAVISVILTLSLGVGLALWAQRAANQLPIRIEMDPAATELSLDLVLAPREAASRGAVENTKGPYVASKNGARYYPVDCKAANRIKTANKIYFSTKVEAERAGYTPAANCPVAR